MKQSPIILAVDTDTVEVAHQWVDATRDYVGIYKVGLEFFLRFGRTGVEEIAKRSGREIFLDLKLHDIPNTVAGAVRAVSALQPRFLTVHASGGNEMISAAVQAAGAIDITAVTILTSLSQENIEDIGFAGEISDVAMGLAARAREAGARAIVCSPHEIVAIRGVVGPGISIITPGIRLEDGGDDQKRTMTPAQAIAAGANFLVIGRPITGAWREGAAAMSAAAEKIYRACVE